MDEGYDAINLDRARDLAAGRPLAALPPEAFETAQRQGPERARRAGRRRAARRRVTDADAPTAEPWSHPTRPGWREVAVLVAIVALAALLRLPGLDQRGAWDADQGTDMLVLQGLVDRGEVPLLGPPTSIGTFHHGAVYYYLLAPAAFLSGADPVAVTTEIALFGIGAVIAAWWLARLVAGPVAGLAAALLAAVSPAGIEASTFIWNPNLIPLASAVAFAAALYAIRSRHARWWLLSALGAMVVMQCHVLGVVVVPPLLVAWLADVRGRRRRDERLGPAVGAGVGGARDPRGRLPAAARLRAPARLRGDAGDPRLSRRERQRRRVRRAGPDRDRRRPVDRLAGLGAVHRSPAARDRGGGRRLRPGRDRRAGRPGDRPPRRGLARRVRRLGDRRARAVRAEPRRDHARACRTTTTTRSSTRSCSHCSGPGSPTSPGARRTRERLRLQVPCRPGGPPPPLGSASLLVVVSIVAWPPATSPDGGWRLADAAAARTIRSTGDLPFQLVGIPRFKNSNAMRFPLEHRGASPVAIDASATPGGPLVVVCDPLFNEVVGAACGGPAEDALLAAGGAAGMDLLDRFDAGSRRVISVYDGNP